MATQTPTVVVGGSVEGNIGSCEVKTTSISKSSFYTQTIAVNSCSGEIVSNNTFYDWSYVYFPLVLVIVFILIFGAFKTIFD